MRRLTALVALLGVAGAAPATAESLGFQYTIEREHEGSVIDATFLRGFETRDGLRLRIKLNQESYCYVIMRAPVGGYRLVFPDSGTLKGGGLPINEWARIPKTTFLRMGEDPSVQRIYIIVAAQRVPELDEAAARGQALSEAVASEVRGRYQGGGSVTREQDGQTVSIKYRAEPSGTLSVVEEITLQGVDTSKRPESK
jgi:hypothetical protein